MNTTKKSTKKRVTKKEEAKTQEEPKHEYYFAVGRRKESVARTKLYVTDESVAVGEETVKKGEMVVNGRPAHLYFPGEIMKRQYLEPFRTTNTIGRFAVVAVILGGGLSGQLGAFIHSISRALTLVDTEKFRPILKKKGFLTRDSRMKERRKAGFAQKARARKQSPKR